VGLRAGLDTEGRGKILCPCRGSNLYRPVFQSVVDTILSEVPHWKSVTFERFTEYYKNVQIKEGDVSGTCSMHDVMRNLYKIVI
jgi:hypothetical protein